MQLTYDIKLDTFQEAQIYLLRLLTRQGYRYSNLMYRNRQRYLLVIGEEGQPNYFIMFKTETFHSFGDYFKGRYEEGESINLDSLQECFRHNVEKIFVIYPDKKMLWIIPQDMVLLGHKRENESEGKITYSVSMNDLKNFEGVD